jgi:hypothetical protein
MSMIGHFLFIPIASMVWAIKMALEFWWVLLIVSIYLLYLNNKV